MSAIRIDLPADPEAVAKLKVGDQVSLYGRIVTGRDAAHKFLVEEECPAPIRKLLKGTFIYHCGPVVSQADGRWSVVAAGPTTSIREEPYQATVIEQYGLAGAIGKGGMGPRTLAGLEATGTVYLHAVGGVATLLAERIKGVTEVHMLEEFGTPEAFWVLEVEDFPALVTMDSHGNSLHKEVREESEAKFNKLVG
jgi:fumarate hydratase subunit beta